MGTGREELCSSHLGKSRHTEWVKAARGARRWHWYLITIRIQPKHHSGAPSGVTERIIPRKAQRSFRGGKTVTWIYDPISVHPPPEVEYEVLHGKACVLVTTIHAIKPRKIPQASSGSSNTLRQSLHTFDFKDAIAIFNKAAAWVRPVFIFLLSYCLLFAWAKTWTNSRLHFTLVIAEI